MEKDDFALLKVIASSIETIKDDIKEMKESMKTKVEVGDFKDLKEDVKTLQEKSEALHNKWWFASGIAASVSYVINIIK